VPSPLEKSVVVIAVNGVEAKALVKGFGFDAVGFMEPRSLITSLNR
jgi:hypothetical protein